MVDTQATTKMVHIIRKQVEEEERSKNGLIKCTLPRKMNPPYTDGKCHVSWKLQ